MPLNIKDSETHALAKQLAGVTGETLTQAVRRAVHERLARVRTVHDGNSLASELDRIALHCAHLPKRDTRSADDIIGYDERGVPA